MLFGTVANATPPVNNIGAVALIENKKASITLDIISLKHCGKTILTNVLLVLMPKLKLAINIFLSISIKLFSIFLSKKGNIIRASAIPPENMHLPNPNIYTITA